MQRKTGQPGYLVTKEAPTCCLFMRISQLIIFPTSTESKACIHGAPSGLSLDLILSSGGLLLRRYVKAKRCFDKRYTHSAYEQYLTVNSPCCGGSNNSFWPYGNSNSRSRRCAELTTELQTLKWRSRSRSERDLAKGNTGLCEQWQSSKNWPPAGKKWCKMLGKYDKQQQLLFV